MNKRLIFLWLVLPVIISSQTLMVSGSPWIVTLDYPFDDVLSLDPQVQISIKPKTDWLVTVQKDEINWQSDLKLYIHRTGDGAGNPQSVPQGGLSWIEIMESPNDFFWGGAKNRNNVPAQYLLQADWPAEGSYSTTVTFTLLER